MKRSGILLVVLACLAARSAAAQTFQVEHSRLFGRCRGTLVFDDTTVRYIPEKKEPARIWKYEDIQQLAVAPGRISILTYHSRKAELGRDQLFNFRVLSRALDDQFRKDMESRLGRPLVWGVPPRPMAVRFSIPARHRLFLRDSQGVLEFGEDTIVYRSNKPGDSRLWRYEDLLSVGSTGPFQLRLGALEKTGGEFGEEKNYVFDLKRRLTSEEYDFVWEKINRRTIAGERP